MYGEKMKILLKKVGEVPKVMEIENTLEQMQALVGGYIETVPLPDDTAVIVCNEEGKLHGLEPNMFLLNKGGVPYDVICGDFFIVDAPIDSDDFGSLSDEQIEVYTQFGRVEWISQ